MAHDIARDAYINRNYRLAAELYEQCLKERGPSHDLYLGYGNSLAKCGQIRESLDVFSHCYLVLGAVPPQDKLRHLSGALLDAVVSTALQRGVGRARTGGVGLACALCEGVLHAPVTVDCGHTFCRRCLERGEVRACVLCGHRLALRSAQLDTNIVVRGLVEKWWAAAGEAARRRDEGNEMFMRNDAEGALVKYDQAVAYAPQDHRILSNRSRALQCLNRMLEALADADSVVRLRPTWGNGHYRRGVLLCGLGRYEEALVALCVSAALDASTVRVKTEATHALHRLLASQTARSRCRSPALTVVAPYARGAHVKPHAKAVAYLAMPALYSDNDSESDSCEDDSSQMLGQRWGACSATALQENTKLHGLLDCINSEVDTAIRAKVDCKSSSDLYINPQLVDLTDFECILCCRTLWRPVTTPCGHTYCWSCLDRCLDYSSACPLCMTSLEMYLESSQRGVTEFIERALRSLLPGVYAERQASYCQELLPSGQHIPIFVCTAAFPGVPSPLFVYEPRYRNMVRRCVQTGSRQFGMVACLGQTGGNRYAEYGTMQEIKDCVLMPDGCSIVTTLGRRRFRVVAHGERDGYDTAQVEFLRDDAIRADQLPGLNQLHDRIYHKSYSWFHSNSSSIQGEIARVFGHMPALEEDWSNNLDGPAWTWWLLAILPLGPRLQVGILATTNLEKRLRAIDKTLNHIQQSLPQLVVREPDHRNGDTSDLIRANQSRSRPQRNQINTQSSGIANPGTSQVGSRNNRSSSQFQA